MDVPLLSRRQIMWEIVSNFVAYLENLNFTPGMYNRDPKSVRKTCVVRLCKVWNNNWIWGPMNIITQMRPLLNTTDPYAMTYIQPQKVNKKQTEVGKASTHS